MPWSTSSSAPCAPSNRMRLPSRSALRRAVAPDRVRRTAARRRRCSARSVCSRWRSTGGWPKPRAQGVVVREQASSLRLERRRGRQVLTRIARRADLVLVGRADAAAGGADLARAARRPRAASRSRWIRQDQRAGLARCQARAHLDALLAQLLDLLRQRPGSTTTPLPMTDSVRAHDAATGAARAEVLSADHQRVAGVVAALEAHDDVGAAR